MKNSTQRQHLSFLLFLISLMLLPLSATGADNRFSQLADGTIKDSRTGLTWAASDNGANITWLAAMHYCQKYSAEKEGEWRMPTPEELATLYGASKSSKGEEDKYTVDLATDLIKVSAPWVWSSRKSPNKNAVVYGFNYGNTRKFFRGKGMNRRALPVKSGK